MQTKRIRLGPGGFLLPYHHPAELANRVAMMDTSRAAGSISASPPGACRATGQCSTSMAVGRQPRHDPRGARDHPEAVGSTEPFDYKGKYWNVSKPGEMSVR